MKKITRDEFVSRINKLYNGNINLDEYDFKGTQYSGKCKCKICGYEWESKAYSLMQGHGCRRCYDERNSKNRTYSIEQVQKLIDDSDAECKIIGGYIDTKHKCIAKCNKCGYEWKPNVRDLINGHSCPKCAREKIGETKRITQEEYIDRCKAIYDDLFDYSEINYVKMTENVHPICKVHGRLTIRANTFLKGCGCKKCKSGHKKEKQIIRKKEATSLINKNKFTKEIFLNKAKEIHGNKYDYSKVKYINSMTKVCIICPIHGEFWQTPSGHLSGHGCRKCGFNKTKEKKTSTTKEFIEKATEVHGNKYDYSKVIYKHNKKKVCIICPEHGEFFQTPHEHLDGCGCKKCCFIDSKSEYEIIDVLSSLEIVHNERKILGGKEIDVYIPNLKLGIEYNGLVWHSEKFGKDRHYHLDKLEECNRQGIKLIQIFEDEWINHREICESKLKQICRLNKNPKIYGRKCEIRLIDNKNEAYEFLDKNHIQGRTGFTLAIGAFYEGNLVGVMCFKCEKEGYWDLNRFATDINYQCVGIGGKLFKYFIRNYTYKEIKSFADRRWTVNPTDNLYTKLGFGFDSYVEPTYWYYKSGYERRHKFGFRKQVLNKKYGLPLTMTELEMTKELGYTRIWDCGLIKYVYKNINDK